MFSRKPRLRVLLVTTLCLTAALPPQLLAEDWFRNPLRRGKPPVEELAEIIDDLEEDMAEYGAVSAKSPDIWGEARLTQHRQEFERQMEARIEDFRFGYNAAIARSDQAFLTEALAVSAAIGGSRALVRNGQGDPQALYPGNVNITNSTMSANTPSTTAPTGPSQVTVDQTLDVDRNHPFDDAHRFVSKDDIQLEPTILLDQRKRFLDHLHEIRRVNEGDDTTDSPGYSLNLVRVPISVLPGDKTRVGYGAEITLIARPHITEELLPKTWRMLVINDLVDQLALPLVRISEARPWELSALQEPMNVFSGATVALKMGLEEFLRWRRTGKELTGTLDAAEVTRQLVAATETSKEKADKVLELLHIFQASENELHRISAELCVPVDIQRLAPKKVEVLEAALKEISLGANQVQAEKRRLPPRRVPLGDGFDESPDFHGMPEPKLKQLNELIDNVARNVESAADEIAGIIAAANDVLTSLGNIQTGIAGNIERIATPQMPAATSRARTSRYAVPPSRLVSVYGQHELMAVAKWLYQIHQQQCSGKTELHLSDAQSILNEELQAAYDFLSTAESAEYWTCIADLGRAIRNGRDVGGVRPTVTGFVPGVEVSGDQQLCPKCYLVNPATGQPAGDPHTCVTRALAWAILVESALLNIRLNEDLVLVRDDPNCGCVPDGEFEFAGPFSTVEARQAFIEYVKCRWPVHVFAVDPVIQEQNVSDVFSLRREMQVSLALAVASGRINMQNLTRFVRRIEVDMQTVALNRTIVGFGAGDDTFGWQFFPRVQTPDFRSNAEVFWRDLVLGDRSRDSELNEFRIEPGIRECMALVVMPSFIDHISFETRGNWFQLAPNCCFHRTRDTGVEMEEVAEWSAELRKAKDLMCAGSLDDGRHMPETAQLFASRIDQLHRKLPLQQLYARVPSGNTIGGFQMFSSGVTDLAPELIGWYGEPGVDPNRETVMFLVGRNFSVHATKVVAGNMDVEFDLLSREVMRVVIPPGVAVTDCPEYKRPPIGAPCGPNGANGQQCATPDTVVDVHLATPYGVSGHLHLPVVSQAQELPPTLHWTLQEYPIRYSYTSRLANGMTPPYEFVIADGDIQVSQPLQLVVEVPRGAILPGTTGTLRAMLVTAEDLPGLPAGTVVGGVEPPTLAASPRLTYDPVQSAFVLRDADFANLHKYMKDTIRTFLNGQYRLTGEAPSLMRLTIQASIAVGTGDTSVSLPVPAEMQIVVRFVKKQ